MENRIQSDPEMMFGKPVIKGTRITIELILGKIAAGDLVETILSSYLHLTRERILACVAFAGRALSLETIFPLGVRGSRRMKTLSLR